MRNALMRFHPDRLHRARLLPALLSALLVFSGSSCQTTPKKQPSLKPKGLKQELAQRDAAIVQLKEDAGRQGALLAEKEVLIRQLEQSLLSQQRMLDDAIQEVVRVKAKQRSLESRAEAASEMAEAEIALKSLRSRATGTSRPELVNAEQLLARATREFEGQNFGGALYLVSQAKSQIKQGSLRLGDQGKAEEGETPFVVPLALVIGTRGNLREGPGQEFKTLATLDQGTRITAYFTRGLWLRVECEGGMSGWIHRSLISQN
jgi:hypothetical protein